MTTDIDSVLLKISSNYQVPGQTFRLPSRGRFYKNGELSDEVVDGEVVVYPMTTLEEMYTRSFDMLFQGTAIEKTISRCVPQIKEPMKLLNKDVDYLMSCIRKVSYGEYISYKLTCPDTLNAKEIEYEIPITSFLRKTKEVSDDIENSLNFEFDGLPVKARFSTYADTIKINQSNYDENNVDGMFSFLISHMAETIESIDTLNTREQVIELLKKAPRQFVTDLADVLSKINEWGTDYTYDINCKLCGKAHNVTISLNPTYFFTQPSEAAIKSE